MSENNLTQEQKIDELYKIMIEMNRRQKINSWVKVLFWITMIGYSYYFMVVTLPSLLKNFSVLSGAMGNESSGIDVNSLLENNPKVQEMMQNNPTMSEALKNYFSQ